MIGKESIVGKVIYGGGFVFDFARWLVILAVVLTLLHFFVITIYIVDGASMDPTLKTGEIAVLNKIVYDFGDPARGDIVVVKYPGDPENKRYVKRVIGLPNEKVEVRAGGVYINNKRVDIPAYTVKLGEEVSIKTKEPMLERLTETHEALKDRAIPKWLEVDAKNFKSKVVALPTKDDVGFPIREQLIVELYSK